MFIPKRAQMLVLKPAALEISSEVAIDARDQTANRASDTGRGLMGFHICGARKFM